MPKPVLFQKGERFFFTGMNFIQIWSAEPRSFLRLLQPPSIDPGMIAGKKDGRDGFSLPDFGTGVLWVFQKAVMEGFIFCGFFVF